MGLALENGTKYEIVPGYNLSDFTFSVPARMKLEKGLDFYYKKARSSVILLMCFSIPPFYLIGPADG